MSNLNSNPNVNFYVFCRKIKNTPELGSLYLRISVRYQKTELALKRRIKLKDWDKVLQLSKARSSDAKQLGWV